MKPFAPSRLRLLEPPPDRPRRRKPAPPPEPPKLAPGTHAPGPAGPPRPVTGPEGRPLPTGSVIYGQAGWDYLTSPTYRRVTVWADPGLRATELPAGSGSIPGVGWVRMENVHRREVPHIAEAIQPRPVVVDIGRFGGEAYLAREWAEDPRPACRLCRTCNAWRHAGRPGFWVCHTKVPYDLADEDAALYEQPD